MMFAKADLTPVEIELPPRQFNTKYKRPKMLTQRFVQKVYWEPL
jgi:hypothetical protein